LVRRPGGHVPTVPGSHQAGALREGALRQRLRVGGAGGAFDAGRVGVERHVGLVGVGGAEGGFGGAQDGLCGGGEAGHDVWGVFVFLVESFVVGRGVSLFVVESKVHATRAGRVPSTPPHAKQSGCTALTVAPVWRRAADLGFLCREAVGAIGAVPQPHRLLVRPLSARDRLTAHVVVAGGWQAFGGGRRALVHGGHAARAAVAAAGQPRGVEADFAQRGAVACGPAVAGWDDALPLRPGECTRGGFELPAGYPHRRSCGPGPWTVGAHTARLASVGGGCIIAGSAPWVVYGFSRVLREGVCVRRGSD